MLFVCICIGSYVNYLWYFTQTVWWDPLESAEFEASCCFVFAVALADFVTEMGYGIFPLFCMFVFCSGCFGRRRILPMVLFHLGVMGCMVIHMLFLKQYMV